MKIKGYDLIMVDYDFYIYKSNLENKKLLYDKTDKIFINSNYDSGTLGETIDSSDYKIYSINDIECLEVATTENVERLDSSWVLPDKKPNLDKIMKKVFVSGGSGFISLHLISKLIQEGYQVRTSLRSLDRKQEVIDAVEKEVSTAGMLEFCELDLLKDEGWDEAVAGCDYVQHIASPIPTTSSNDYDIVVKPAVNGIKRCLNAALKNNVKRFVMTSSVAAVGGSNHKFEYDDTDWTDLSMDVAPYQTSKTKAEQYLWDFMKEHEGKTDMEAVAINPSMVFGSSLSDDIGASNLVIKRLIDGSLPVTLNICINIVHIKDVADMHFEAMINDKAPGKRFIASNNHMFFPEIAKVLNENGFKAPKIKLPSFLARVFSIFDKQIKHFVKDIDILRVYHAQNAKDVLGWKFRSSESAIIDAATQIKKLL
jgi:dihydroflavonol-4-reductase